MSLADFKTVFCDCYTVRFMIMEKLKFSAVREMNKFVEVISFSVYLCYNTRGIYMNT
jgi:hypothetical protein